MPIEIWFDGRRIELPNTDYLGNNSGKVLREFFGVRRGTDLFLESDYTDDDILVESRKSYVVGNRAKFYTSRATKRRCLHSCPSCTSGQKELALCADPWHAPEGVKTTKDGPCELPSLR